MVREEADVLNPITVPAINVTLDEEPLRLKFVATGTAGPMILMVLRDELKVMFAPATSEALELLPFKLKFVAAGTVGPTIVMLFTPVLSVMLAPADRMIVPELVAEGVPKAAT